MKSIERRIKKLEEKINPGIKKDIEKIISKIGLLFECYLKACPTLKPEFDTARYKNLL